MISEAFFDYFKDFKDDYVVIGGNAASILLANDGQAFRATQDYDVVIIFENSGGEFSTKFMAFINDYGYVQTDGGIADDGQKNYYRFHRNNNNTDVPVQIELFSRKPLAYNLKVDNHKTPLHLEGGPSLSAIVLNDNYYGLLKTGVRQIGNESILGASALIYFKAKAHLDVQERISHGESITHRADKTKHFKDVCRLCTLLPEADFDPNTVPNSCQEDLQKFIALVEAEDARMLKSRFRNDPDFDMSKNEIVDSLKSLLAN